MRAIALPTARVSADETPNRDTRGGCGGDAGGAVGPVYIPNACTGCHADRSNDWSTEALRGWTGMSPWRATQ